jgi:hypothetical protein
MNVVVVRSEPQLVAGTGARAARRERRGLPSRFLNSLKNFFRETTDLETAKGKQNIISRARRANI